MKERAVEQQHFQICRVGVEREIKRYRNNVQRGGFCRGLFKTRRGAQIGEISRHSEEKRYGDTRRNARHEMVCRRVHAPERRGMYRYYQYCGYYAENVKRSEIVSVIH